MDQHPSRALERWSACRIWLAACLLATCTQGQASSADLAAFTQQWVHPLLIRNDQNVLLQVVVQVGDQAAVHVRSMAFSLEGTDALDDVESLGLFSTGNAGTFSAENAFDESSQAAEQIRFDGDQKLEPGDNFFWLSCR